MEAKHTPGPWTYELEQGRIQADGEDTIAEVWGYKAPGEVGAEALHNARLIAAAPEMAELLETLVEDGDSAGLRAKARVLLSKLKGE